MDGDITVDGAALRADIERAGSFGSVEADTGRGRTALPGDEANGRVREYLVERMEDIGLDVRVDAVGNIAGRLNPSSADTEAPPVATGSHLDSVPRGGIFDGILGVFAALEATRAIRDSTTPICQPLEVVCFTGEEGTRFADGVLGSSVATGKLSAADALSLSDGEVTLADALDGIGFHGTGRLDARNWDAWLELHIEQGGSLADSAAPLGIVTDITGTARGHVTIEGEPDHSGTTSMGDRRDALAAASEFVLDVEQTATDIAASGTGTAVGTVGRIDPDPNIVNVVPGSVSIRFDIRSIDQSEIDAQVQAVRSALENLEANRNVETTFELPYDIPPTPLSPRIRDVVRRTARRNDVETATLHSGGGHDTMQVADVTDAALLFAPSKGGHSHSPKEWADWSDCTTTTQILAESLVRLASTEN